jgi:hypothetical protein
MIHPKTVMFYKSSIFAAASSLLTAALVLVSVGGAIAADEKTSYVGPSIGFSNGTTLYGINAKIKVADSISVRPFIQFGSISAGPVSATLTNYGASATYDFSLPDAGFNPYLGVGVLGSSVSVGNFGSASGSGIYFEAGADYNASESIVINANYKFRDSGYLSIGGGYRF